MQYMRSVKFIFDNPRWWLFPLIALLGFMVPILGMLVLFGYLIDMVELFHRTGKDEYEDFDFNRLNDYFTKGAWAFLAALVVGLCALPIMFLYMGFNGLGMFIGHLVDNKELAGVIAVACMAIGFVFYFIALIFINLVSIPVMLGAGLTKSFRGGLSWPYVKGFISRTWKEMVVSLLFLWAVSIVAVLIGYMLLCIGVYLTIGLVMLVQWHLIWQLYELYLQRGGTPLTDPEGTWVLEDSDENAQG